MLKEDRFALEGDELPEVEVRTRRGISLVWLIPLVAGAIAIWLAYATLQEKGPKITVLFDSAEGLEAGKTPVKYLNVEVGLVDDVALSEDLSHIIVTADLDKSMAAHMKEGTRFWIVRPRIGRGGISGLGESDPRRAGGLGLERPLRLHLLPPVVSVQPVR
jgi:paraquat-inducible protein B